ncbi:MAG: hypothetical protein AAB521_03140 [Patescibacteria group bacterium]
MNKKSFVSDFKKDKDDDDIEVYSEQRIKEFLEEDKLPQRNLENLA